MFATRFRDAQCGFKAVRADVARRLLPAIEDDGWFFDTELLVLAEHNGLRIHEVPVDWVDDADSRVDVVAHRARRPARASPAWRDVLRRAAARLDLGDVARPALEDDFGRRLVQLRRDRLRQHLRVAGAVPAPARHRSARSARTRSR